MARKLLHWLFTGLYFSLCFLLIRYCFARLPVNFVWDLAAIAALLAALVLSVGLAEATVKKLVEELKKE